MTALLALILKTLGAAFLVVATLGVLRFRDPFQRMHAATKAGTLGAGLVLAGAAVTKGSFDATMVAVLTIVFLIATMPVAGHLLGRAAYISGAPLRGRSDALAGILPRMALPLEARLGDASVSAFAGAPAAERSWPAAGLLGAGRPEPEGLPEMEDEGSPVEPGYAAVRFAVIGGPNAEHVARRAWELATARNVPLSGFAVVDESCLEEARVPAAVDCVRTRLAEAIAETRRVAGQGGVPFTLVYEEGDPLAIIPSQDIARREILLLPTDGWCHHGARITLPVYEGRLADKLFTLADRHAGPVLFAGTEKAAEPRCIVVHDGSTRLQRLATWALRTGLWPVGKVTVTGRPSPAQLAALEHAAADLDLESEFLRKTRAPLGALLPRHHAGVTALITSVPPQPPRANAYGTFWQDRLIPGFRGDVLVA
jgi:monovalent cation/proton antiporter MnhG/PhaG subunit